MQHRSAQLGPFTPPLAVEEFRIEEMVGRGASGQVFRAHDTLLERAVAIKFLSSRSRSARARQRFLVEARAIARLKHPNVVTVHRFGEWMGRPYLVSEYVAGQSLARTPKPMPWRQALTLGAELARGLAAAHHEGILHRDIKPADVEGLLLVGEEGVRVGCGQVMSTRSSPLDAVRKEFGAHYGGIAGFDVDPAFAPYKQGAAVVLHRQGRGTLMFVALYDEMTEPVEGEWMTAFHSLRFTEPFVSAESAELRAMAVMGSSVPFETRYYDLKYLPGSRFSARVFRVDNMERGDLTPEQPTEELFQYKRQGKKLDLRGPVKWSCELDR